MNWVRKVLTGRYTLFLEEECIRLRHEAEQLRKENRALVNSLLGTAGLPPMSEERKEALAPAVRRRSWHQIQAGTEREALQRIRKRAEADEKAEEASPAGEAS